MIRSACPAMASIGRSPRRSTMNTPRPMSSTTASEPSTIMTSTWSMVEATWARLVPTTRIPPGVRSAWMRVSAPPTGPITVCGPGWSTTRAAAGARVHSAP